MDDMRILKWAWPESCNPF